MSATDIRQKLHSYLEIAGDEKLQALYLVMQHDIEEAAVTYTPEFCAELDRRYTAYLSDKKEVVTAAQSKLRIEKADEQRAGQ